MTFDKLMCLCNPSPFHDLVIPSIPKIPLCSFLIGLCPHSPEAATVLILESSTHGAFPRASSEWNHAVRILWFEVSFTWYNVSEIHPCCCVYQQSFLFISEQYSLVWLYHRWFLHSSVDGHWAVSSLGLFWVKLLRMSSYRSFFFLVDMGFHYS